MQREKTKCMIEKCEAGKSRITGEKRGTNSKEEHSGTRARIKGAASAKGESEMREGAKKISRGKQRMTGEKGRHKR